MGQLEDTYRQKRNQTILEQSKVQAAQDAVEKHIVNHIVRDIIPTIIARAKKTTLGRYAFITVNGVEYVAWTIRVHYPGDSPETVYLLSDGRLVDSYTGFGTTRISSQYYQDLRDLAFEVGVPSETLKYWKRDIDSYREEKWLPKKVEPVLYKWHWWYCFLNDELAIKLSKKPTFWSRLFD